jgi:signal transduction histidine kinase
LRWSSRIMPIVLRNALTATVYFFVGKAALSLALLHPSITVVWPSTGVAIAACLLSAYRVWPGVLVGAFLVNQTTLGTVLTSALIAAGNTLEALLGAYLLNRFARGRRTFWQAEGVLTFTVLVAVLSTTVSATIGVTSLALAGDATETPLDLMWLTWWLGDATGALIVTPVVVLWSSSVPRAGRPRRTLEGVLVLGLLVLVSQLVFGRLAPVSAQRFALELLFVPLLTWGAVRLGPRHVALGILLVAATALVGTLQGVGPFVRDSAQASLLVLQFFLGIMAMTAFATAAAVAERGEALAALQRSTTGALAAEERLRAQIAEFLHSHVQSRLLMAWHRLRTALQRGPQEPEAAWTLVAQVADFLEEIREQDVRQASYLLHPTFIREGLTPALYALMERFEGHLELTLTLDPALAAWDTPLRNRLPEALRLAAFRIFEEALGNVVHHAQATTVHMTLGLEGQDALVLTVADNGQGFDVDGVQPGLGLASIESRVHQVGGQWHITSQQGQGTTVVVRLALRPSSGPA